jgi:hypothetical protein
VEKLVYVLWKRPEVSLEDFGREIRGPVAQQLVDSVRALSVNLADEKAEYARGLRITKSSNPLVGTVSVWINTSLERDAVEEVLAGATARLAGYQVVESVPIPNVTHVVPLGVRAPGITTVAFLERPEAMTYETWLDHWQGHHTRVAIETQSTYLYIQNVIVRSLTPGAPPWAAIVEEGFPAAAATDPMVFYDAAGSKEKLDENRRRMIESCRTFIDFERLETHPMSSYILRDGA